jgi:hypothetical protein
MEELDKYLSGQISDEERRAFENKLVEQPDLQAELMLREGMRQLHLQQKTAAAAQLRKTHERSARRQRIAWASLFVVGLVGVLIGWYLQTSGSKSMQPPAPAIEKPADNLQSPPTVEPPASAPPSRPVIAENQTENASSTDPFTPRPDLRGSNADSSPRQVLLDELWHTAYPPADWQPGETLATADSLLRQGRFAQAYVRLQRLEMRVPANDTLRLMKGFCLLEMREGAEAINYWENLEDRQPDWNAFLQWHRGLALLLKGERAAAEQIFRSISANRDHPFATQARKALEVLEKGK